MPSRHSDRPHPAKPLRLEVAGAGPAGLAAAITAARAGLRVVVHEQAKQVGSRFHGDFQGLENWTTEGDVLDELAALGIDARFDHTPFREQVIYDLDGTARRLTSKTPFYYLVRRGPGEGTLDSALLAQAREVGVEVRFGDPVHSLPEGGIVAHGPRASDAVAVGWNFRTDLPDGGYAALGEEIAPKGYAYLLVAGGRATLAVCLFADFHHEDRYLDRALELFQERLGFQMSELHHFGGAGAVRLPDSAVHGRNLLAGEAAGFQDPLWGFGMRYALLSGHFAARAWIDGTPELYSGLWRQRLGGLMKAGAVNRLLLEVGGDFAIRRLLRSVARAADPRARMRRLYAPSWLTTLLFPIAKVVVFRPIDPAECSERDCDCTWCRCVRGMPRDFHHDDVPVLGNR